MSDERIVKVPMPVELIRRMDEALVANLGGFSTRAEFIKEAAENLLIELRYDEAEPEPAARARSSMSSGPTVPKPSTPNNDGRARPAADGDEVPAVPLEILEAVPSWEREELRLADLVGTALRPSDRGFVLEAGIAKPDDGPLLGLHNRDYPSLWAAHRLARYTKDGPLELRDFLQRATNAAWIFGAGLRELERAEAGTKLTALFPANPMKRQSAERGFQAFAIGTVPKRIDGDELRVVGPLFVWGLCQVVRTDNELFVGLTSAGWQLLEEMEGISLVLPHGAEHAQRFLKHLEKAAPADRWGFDHLMTVVADAPNRDTLVDAFAESQPRWSQSTASSMAQGYVARAREWGLVEPRLDDGRYRLTPLGNEFASQVRES